MAEHQYRAYGLNIVSDWPLPTLASAQFAQPDLEIRHAPLAKHLGENWAEECTVFRNWEAATGRFLMKVNNVANFLAVDGRLLLIERANDAVGDDAVTAYMMGSMMAAILQQRGTSLLHASSVETAAGALVFAGPSGIGKSTLAMRLSQGGHALIADDVTPLKLDDAGRALAIPAFPTARLWEDAVDKLATNGAVKRRVRPELDKYVVSVKGFCAQPRPVHALYLLRSCAVDAVSIEPVTRAQRHKKLVAQGFRNGFLKAHRVYADNFRTMVQVAKAVPMFAVTRPREGFALDELASAIADHAANIQPGD